MQFNSSPMDIEFHYWHKAGDTDSATAPPIWQQASKEMTRARIEWYECTDRCDN